MSDWADERAETIIERCIQTPKHGDAPWLAREIAAALRVERHQRDVAISDLDQMSKALTVEIETKLNAARTWDVHSAVVNNAFEPTVGIDAESGVGLSDIGLCDAGVKLVSLIDAEGDVIAWVPERKADVIRRMLEFAYELAPNTGDIDG